MENLLQLDDIASEMHEEDQKVNNENNLQD